MAERKIAGKDVLLFLDLAGGTAYDMIVCLTQNSIKRTTAQTENASKCGPDVGAGAQTITIDFTGQVVYDAAANRVSEGDLHDAWSDSRTVGWKMGTLDPITGDVIYSGQGFISDLSADYSMTGATFTATIGIQNGPIVKTIFAGS